jgi:high-affinity iron transporter
MIRRRHAPLVVAVVALLLPVSAWAAEPWRSAAEVRASLTGAQNALLLDEGRGRAAARAGDASLAAGPLLAGLRRRAPDATRRAERALAAAERAARSGDGPRLAAAYADAWTAILGGAFRNSVAAARAGRREEARAWLLVREFRPPTRFTRAAAEATLALDALSTARPPRVRAEAATKVRADLLDTYQALLGSALDELEEAATLGYDAKRAGSAALARGYFAILRPALSEQLGAARSGRATAAFDRLAEAALAGDRPELARRRAAVEASLEGFRAAPLAEDEAARRAGQVLRFLSLVPIEYDRGVDDGRVTIEFEIQEAITFRAGAAQSFRDLQPTLARRDAGSTARFDSLLEELGATLAAAARGERVADPESVERATASARELAERLFPEPWLEAEGSADFELIRATLNRLEHAVRAGRYGDAEQARIEAYAVFEFGPEQRLRGLAPHLFARVEGYFWYGAEGSPGLAQLLKRRSGHEEVAHTREGLDAALADAESAVGSGPTSRTAVITNTAVIVFREGLEAILILAALAAGLVQARRRFRRPLLVGAAGALVASALTWAVAQTVLGSLARYGEKLEAIVSLVAIGVLLLILNWFYHRVYWNDHLAGLHTRKKRILRSPATGVVGAQMLALVALGFSSVYREGFETVLFLQAIVLEAGAPDVLLGVLVGLVGVAAVGLLTIALQRKLPHKRMLVVTGVLILAVLVVMVGSTVQTLQVVGWIPVHPVDGLTVPYWAGVWLGVFPTWEGLSAQLGAAVVVLGSYVVAEWLRARRRRARLAPATGRSSSAGLPHRVRPQAARPRQLQQAERLAEQAPQSR